jgi:hypothetical protein
MVIDASEMIRSMTRTDSICDPRTRRFLSHAHGAGRMIDHIYTMWCHFGHGWRTPRTTLRPQLHNRRSPDATIPQLLKTHQAVALPNDSAAPFKSRHREYLADGHLYPPRHFRSTLAIFGQ